jgi:hypothetical protein
LIQLPIGEVDTGDILAGEVNRGRGGVHGITVDKLGGVLVAAVAADGAGDSKEGEGGGLADAVWDVACASHNGRANKW